MQILARTTKSPTAGAFLCFLSGWSMVVFAVIAAIFRVWPMVAYLGVMGIGLVIGGVAYRRAARTEKG